MSEIGTTQVVFVKCHTQFGKVLIFMDSTRYHTKSSLKQLIKETNYIFSLNSFKVYTRTILSKRNSKNSH